MSDRKPRTDDQATTQADDSERAGAWLLRYYATLLTLTYLGLSCFGVLLNAVRCSVLGLNYFDYAQPSDFFVSFFRHWYAVVLLLVIGGGQAVYVWLLRRPSFAAWLKERQAKTNNSWIYSRWVWGTQAKVYQWTLAALFAVVVNLIANALNDAADIKVGRGKRIELTLADGAVVGADAKLSFVGLTSQYVLVFDQKGAQAEAWSVGSIRKFRLFKVDPPVEGS